jgi:thiol-disulfide isomerase/thioredoxin
MKTQRAWLFLTLLVLLLASGLQGAQAGRQRTVPSFKLPNVAGGFMTSDDLKGKVTVIDLWATWCHWCAEEVPVFNQLYDAFQDNDDVSVIGISVDSPRRDVPSKVRQLGMRYPVFIDDDRALQPFGPVRGLPTTVVISKDGTIYKQYEGAVPHKEEKIRQDIQRLLSEDSR